MTFTELVAGNHTFSIFVPGAGDTVESASDFLDALMNCTGILVLERSSLSPAFFDLKTGLAGDCLQKVSNYRKRLVILGDFSNEPSKALRDFVYESNRTGQVVFAPSLEEAAALLR